MRLSVSKALMLALIANLISGCERSYADREQAAAAKFGAAAGGSAAPTDGADAAPAATTQGR